MPQPAVQVEGGKQLRATLKAAGIGVNDLKAAHAQVAGIVATAAAPRTPVRTGRLARVSNRASGTQTTAQVRAGTSAVPYAGPIHWGWPNRHIKARPWIYDAVADTEQTWEARYMAALDAIIAKVEGEPE